jgi:hypothetical protein
VQTRPSSRARLCRGAGESSAQQSGNFVENDIEIYRRARLALFSMPCGAYLIRRPPRDLATMNLFDRKLFLPVDVIITLAINIVLVVLGYYLIMAWGLLGG